MARMIPSYKVCLPPSKDVTDTDGPIWCSSLTIEHEELLDTIRNHNYFVFMYIHIFATRTLILHTYQIPYVFYCC